MTGPTKKELLDIALAARQFEIDLFWKRSLFFWGFIAAAFVGFAATYAQHALVAIAITCFASICSLSWALANRGSKFWYETWEAKAKEVGGAEVKSLFEDMERINSKGWWHAERYSVSRLTIALSDYTTVLWAGLLVFQVYRYFSSRPFRASFESFVVCFICALTVGYAIAIWKKGQGKAWEPA